MTKTLHPILDAVGPDVKKSVAKKPASRWRNKYFNTENILFAHNGKSEWFDGEWRGREVWQSRDIAETAAQRWLAKWAHNLRGRTQYIGAFPIDDEQPQ